MDKVIIGATEYNLEYIVLTEPQDVSEIDLNSNTISIHKDLPPNQQHLALLHEVIHAMNWKLKEDHVEFLAQALYSFMRSNKKLIKEMLK
jgi:hypothetical protein